MSFLPPNASIDVTIPANQSVIIGSYGGGTASIEYATDAARIPRTFYPQAKLTDAQATYGPFTAGRIVRITSGLCELEYSVGTAPFLTRVNKFSQDASGNATGLVGLRSKKIQAALRPLDVRLGPLNAVVMGDSTGNATDEWVYLTAVALAAKYPAHTHSYRLWNDASQQYDQPQTLATGTEGAAHVLTGAQTTAWRMEVADSTVTSIVGDIDVRVKLGFNGSAFSAQGAIAAKFGALGQRSWRLEIDANNKPMFGWTVDGTNNIDKTSTVAITGDSLTGEIWLRATLDVDNGAVGNDVKFYTSTDGAAWAQLGATVTTAGVTSIFDSTSTTQFIGRGAGYMPQQNHAIAFYECEVYSALDGTGRVIDIDVGAMLVTAATAGSSTFIDDVGNTVTVAKGSASGTFVGAPRFAFFNSSASGQAIAYSSDATRYPKQAVSTLSMAFISYGHNEGADIAYRADYKTLTDKLLVTNPDICIFATLQNQRTAPAAYIFEHQLRLQQINDFAASQGFEAIDVYSNLLPADTNSSDGIHPTTAGSTKWYRLVARTLGLPA